MAHLASSWAYRQAHTQGKCACGQSPSCSGSPNLANEDKWRPSPEGFLDRPFGSFAVCINCMRAAKADADKRAEEIAEKRLHNSPHPLRTRRDLKGTPARPAAPRRRSEIDRLHSSYRTDAGRSSVPPNYDARPAFPTSARRGPAQPMETSPRPADVADDDDDSSDGVAPAPDAEAPVEEALNTSEDMASGSEGEAPDEPPRPPPHRVTTRAAPFGDEVAPDGLPVKWPTRGRQTVDSQSQETLVHMVRTLLPLNKQRLDVAARLKTAETRVSTLTQENLRLLEENRTLRGEAASDENEDGWRRSATSKLEKKGLSNFPLLLAKAVAQNRIPLYDAADGPSSITAYLLDDIARNAFAEHTSRFRYHKETKLFWATASLMPSAKKAVSFIGGPRGLGTGKTGPTRHSKANLLGVPSDKQNRDTIRYVC